MITMEGQSNSMMTYNCVERFTDHEVEEVVRFIENFGPGRDGGHVVFVFAVVKVTRRSAGDGGEAHVQVPHPTVTYNMRKDLKIKKSYLYLGVCTEAIIGLYHLQFQVSLTMNVYIS